LDIYGGETFFLKNKKTALTRPEAKKHFITMKVSMALLFNGVDSFPESGHLVMSVACGYVFAGMSCQLHSEFFADAFVRHC
jgi:hypothetical protein